ncbi:MYND finger [Rhizoctonia solani]|uniref:MYND finger n=1 Tax=Rhizoctonia solani TaxID=456999 RepID=A0A8H7I0U8_9AGAM|nr:MYND finger [Rhizoctonia solani]
MRLVFVKVVKYASGQTTKCIISSSHIPFSGFEVLVSQVKQCLLDPSNTGAGADAFALLGALAASDNGIVQRSISKLTGQGTEQSAEHFLNRIHLLKSLFKVSTRILQPKLAFSNGNLPAMMFPVDGERPKLVPITLRGHELSNGSVEWTPRLQNIVGHESEVSSMIITKGVGGETLRFPLHIFFRTHFLTDGSRTNASVYGLTHGQANYQWKGPVVALKFTGTRQSAYTNISMSDLPPLVYFMTYLNSRP